MHPVRQRRLIIVLFIVLGASAAAGLIFYGLNENLNLFYSPSQIAKGEAPIDRTIRAGGMVKKGSVVKAADSLKINFIVTDFASEVAVQYEGIVPDMFSEGEGVVATGKLGADGTFTASEVLAKHDETYMPPEVQDALDSAEKSKGSAY